jgi:hypothetical protein
MAKRPDALYKIIAKLFKCPEKTEISVRSTFDSVLYVATKIRLPAISEPVFVIDKKTNIPGNFPWQAMKFMTFPPVLPPSLKYPVVSATTNAEHATAMPTRTNCAWIALWFLRF